MDPELRKDINLITKEIRKDNRSTRNRIHSIIQDSKFVLNACNTISSSIPIVPNERCGTWYVPPDNYTTTSYFKSTDGHINNWDFSTRRLNFHLLPLLSKHKSLIIVDSTRRGKRMPDSLSKTIPIWIAILNCVMLKPNDTYWFYSPPETVVESEKSRIMAKMPELLSKALDSIVDGGFITQDKLIGMFGKKPLRPIWVYPGAPLPQHFGLGDELDFIPLYLITASYRCQDGTDKRNGYTYVQGASDDEELWSSGLTHRMLWDNLEVFNDLSKSENEILEIIQVLKKKASRAGDEQERIYDHESTITDHLSISKIYSNVTLTPRLIDTYLNNHDLVVILDEDTKLATLPDTNEPTITNNIKVKIFPLSSNSKKSSKELRSKLSEIVDIIRPIIYRSGKVLVMCSTGDDMCIAVILCILCKFYKPTTGVITDDDVGNGGLKTQLLLDADQRVFIDKKLIKNKLIGIIDSVKERRINPSRSTLNSVNAYLMS